MSSTGTQTGNANTSDSNYGIGYRRASSNQYFNGKIDQVRIFNKALSASEVTTLYNENSLVASYRFEGNANDDMRAYNGSATNVTYEYGLGFTPDFVWIKDRTDGTYRHQIYDSTRGATKKLLIITNAESTDTTGLTSFDTGGFTVGTNVGLNTNGNDYVAWAWKANGGTTSSNTDGTVTSTVQANTQAGFSIIKYVGNGVINQSIGHGLNSTPELYITKNLDTSGTGWFTKTTVVDGSLDELALNTSDAASNVTNTNLPTSSVIYQYNNTNLGANGQNYIVYAFHSVENFSKIGSYTGNGSTNGPIVETGFEPAFVMLKRTNGANSWAIIDNKRSTTNPRNKELYANLSDADNTFTALDFLSNGFQLKNTANGYNASGSTYIYMAFAADPDTEAPTVAKSFDIQTYDMTGGSDYDLSFAFKPQFVVTKTRDEAAHWSWGDIIRGNNSNLSSNNYDAVSTTNQWRVKDWYAGATSVTIAQHASINTSNVSYAFKADDNEPTIFGGPAKAVYKFEDNANDVTTNNNGTATNVTYTTGKFNKAVVFNGTNSDIALTRVDDLGGHCSFSVWFNKGVVTGNQQTFLKDNNNNENKIEFGSGTGSEADRILIRVYTSGGRRTVIYYPPTDLRDSDWHHAVFTLNQTANEIKIYVDGELVKTDTSSPSLTRGMSYDTIGKDDTYGVYEGKFDQVRIYKGVLAQEQVTELYNETTSDNDDTLLGGPPETIISANANAGFSIVKYEGTGADMKVAHGLSAAPEMMIIKNLDQADSWVVYHSAVGTGQYLSLDLSTAASGSGDIFGTPSDTGVAPTSTVFTVGSNHKSGASGENYIAYCFHSVSNYSNIGSYAGNGTSQTVTLGFRPDFVILRKYDDNQDWFIFDSVRGDTQPFDARLKANASGVETTSDTNIYATDTGLNFPTASFNDSGKNFIYMAFKIN